MKNLSVGFFVVAFLMVSLCSINAEAEIYINDSDLPIPALCGMFDYYVGPCGYWDMDWSTGSWDGLWASTTPWSPKYAGLAVGIDSQGYYVRVRFQLSLENWQMETAKFSRTSTRIPTALVVGVRELGGQWESLTGGEFEFSISSSNVPTQALLIKGLSTEYDGDTSVFNRMSFLILRPDLLEAHHLYEVVLRPDVWMRSFLSTSFKMDFSVAVNYKLIQAMRNPEGSFMCDIFQLANFLDTQVEMGYTGAGWSLVDGDFPPEIPVKARTEWYYVRTSNKDSLQDNVLLTWGEQPVSCWEGEGSNHGPFASPSKCDGIFKAHLGQEYVPGSTGGQQQCFSFFGRHYCITIPPVPRWGR